MRLIVAADVYANKTRELNVFTVHYPVCIAAVNAKTVLSDFIKYSRVGCVACNLCNLRSPTLEAVAITIGFFLHGSFTVINRSFSVWYAICCKNRVTVLPCYCVFIDNFIKYGCVGCITCNIRNSRGPALEYISILSCSYLCRSIACVCRLCAVSNLAALKNRITVLPGYCVFVDNFIKYSCVGCVACNIRNSRRPALEYVSVLSRSCLSRSIACICRFLAVSNLAALKNSVAVLPGYCVFVDYFIKYGCVGCITCNV